MMDIQVRPADYEDVMTLRELYRQEANCEIVHDSFLGRRLADPYLILVNGRVAGYGGIGNKYPPKCLTEFYVLPAMRPFAVPMYRALLDASQATRVEAQTNMPLMLLMLYDCATNIATDAILFEDTSTTQLACPNGVFRQTRPEEKSSIFQHTREPVGDWLLEVNGAVVATGGFMTHYNPPYADVYMEVAEPERRKGYGSYLVQELKRVCYEAGKKPASRCNLDNLASRATLTKAGLLPCGRMLVGEVNLTA
jgi:GNAT superfamily N-acetyltransferase